MKGFRDLDPGEAEEVVSPRWRKKEYLEDLEAQLYAPLMTGYDAAPSENTPRGRRRAPVEQEQPEQNRPPRREGRRPENRRAVFYDVADETIDRAVEERPRERSRSGPDNRSRSSSVNRSRYGNAPRRRAGRYEEDDYRDPYEDDYGDSYDARYDDGYGDNYDDGYDDGYEETYEDDTPIYEYTDVYMEDEDDAWENRGRSRSRKRKGTGRILLRAALISAAFLVVAVVAMVALKVGVIKGKAPEAADGITQGANDGELENQAEEVPSWTGETESPEEPVEEETAEVSNMPYMTASADKDVFFTGYAPHPSGTTATIEDEEVQSSYAVLINAETGEIVAERDADVVISPASMTKILTLLVAAEHLESLDGSVEMSQEIGDLVFRKDLSAVGYKVGDVVPVKDLLYGTILPSGADAAMMLAEHVAGSQDAFVELMNQKVEELGLSSTAHFSNAVGLFDENNKCTMKDMAMIMKAAVENELCREVLNTRIYTTAPTSEHPEGIEISNWFLRRIEDKDAHGEVVCAKTGFVDESGCCAASYQISNSGGHYLCVTGNAWSSWRCIYDHVRIYDLYTS